MDSQGSSGSFSADMFPFTQRTLPSSPPSSQPPFSSQQPYPSAQRTFPAFTPASTPTSSSSRALHLSQSNSSQPVSPHRPFDSHNQTPWSHIFRPFAAAAGVTNLQGLSTLYDPSTSFSSTNKRLVGCIQEMTSLLQTVERTFTKEKSGLESLMEEIRKVLERVLVSSACSGSLEEREKKGIIRY